jgi:hypothetical protein
LPTVVLLMSAAAAVVGDKNWPLAHDSWLV